VHVYYRIREGEHSRDPEILAHLSRVIAEEWRQEKKPPEAHNPVVPQRWERPERNFVKANCDAAFDPNTGNGGWGCILRDSDADAVIALRGRVEALLSPLQGELIACIQGVQAAISAGVGHVIVETDATEVVSAVYSSEYDLSPVGNLVEELRSLLDWNFTTWKIQQRHRSCNRVAHELAKLGSVCDLGVEPILDPIPANVSCVIADDSALSE
jgi:ribonuclease HI